MQEYQEINGTLFPIQDKYSIPNEDLLKTSVEEYKAAQIKIWEAAKEAVEQSDLSQSTKELIITEAATRVTSSLLGVPSLYISSYMRANRNASNDEYLAYYEKIQKSLSTVSLTSSSVR